MKQKKEDKKYNKVLAFIGICFVFLIISVKLITISLRLKEPRFILLNSSITLFLIIITTYLFYLSLIKKRNYSPTILAILTLVLLYSVILYLLGKYSLLDFALLSSTMLLGMIILVNPLRKRTPKKNKTCNEIYKEHQDISTGFTHSTKEDFDPEETKKLWIEIEKSEIGEDKKPEKKNKGQYVASSTSTKYHVPGCDFAKRISRKNKVYIKDKKEAKSLGLKPCKCVS